MVKRILIAVDDLGPDMQIVNGGIEFAGQLGAEIGIADVARISIGYIDGGIYPEDLEEFNRLRAERTVEQIKARYPDYEFVDFEPIGDPVLEIKNIVEEWKADLLVVGHHRHSFLQRIAENSKERRFINKLDIPVLVIPCE